MSRPLRIAYEGAWYHVMNRGLARAPIFLTDQHREIFLKLLFEIHNRYMAEIHAYCLMNNHYHLLIRTPLGNISRIMRHLDGVYTQRFNSLVKRDGPLFRGRYKSILVDADVYFLRLSRYIHLNPVKAKVVDKPEDYKWSSYKAYIKGKKPDWLTVDYTFSYFDKKFRKIKYKAFVDEGIDKEISDFYKKLKMIPILGTEAFTKTVTEKYLKEEHKVNDIPDHKLLFEGMSANKTIEKIVKSVSSYYGVSVSNIIEPSVGRENIPRSVAIYLAFVVGQSSFSDISSFFEGISKFGVSKVCARLQKKIRRHLELEKRVEEMKAILRTCLPVQT